MSTAVYIVLGCASAIALNRAGLLGTANAMHAMIGFYGGIMGVAAFERKWPLVLYYACAIGISIAVLWMNVKRVA